MSTQKFATKALHAGHDVTKTAGTRAVPIYQTSSYVFNNSDELSVPNTLEVSYPFTHRNKQDFFEQLYFIILMLILSE